MKVRCVQPGCGWRGEHDPSHTAPDPAHPDNEVSTCPACSGTDTLKVVCDEPGCWQPVAVAGDRFVCVNHVPRDELASGLHEGGNFGVASY
jgi:hypothetical protein